MVSALDDLDDGEIPRTNERAPSSNIVRRQDHHERIPDRRVDRSQISPGPYSRSRGSRSPQSHYRGSSRDHPRASNQDYDMHRHAYPGRANERVDRRRDDRYSQTASRQLSPRRRSPARPPVSKPLRQPSVHDANTRADLERLEREREAALYKAKTVALASKVKPAVPPNNTARGSAKEERNDLSVARASSSNPSELPATKTVLEQAHPASPVRSSNSTQTEPANESNNMKLSKQSSQNATSQEPGSIRSAGFAPSKSCPTPADIARLEREKEAALYKARTLQHQQKVRGVVSKSVELQDPKALVVPKQAAISRKIASLTPDLDLEMAALKEEYEALISIDTRNQLSLNVSLRGFLKCQEDCTREIYKTELAEKGLTFAVGF